MTRSSDFGPSKDKDRKDKDIVIVVPPEDAHQRLDSFLAKHFSEFSRSKLQRAVNSGAVSVDGCSAKSSARIRVGQEIRFSIPEPVADGTRPENIPIKLVFEDEHLAVVDKPPAMVVHPAKGHWSGTLAAALAFHFKNLSTLGGATRPGIVHRLDRDTSGIIVVAKTDLAHAELTRQFEQRTVEKEYLAIVSPVPDRDRDSIDKPIGLHPYQREKMAIRDGHQSSRPASTFYEVAERFQRFAVLRVLPKTGRTHQIRLHLAHIGTPVLCDRLYSGRSRLYLRDLTKDPSDETIILSRQALHASRIKLTHPQSGQPVEFNVDPPTDLTATLDLIRKHS